MSAQDGSIDPRVLKLRLKLIELHQRSFNDLTNLADEILTVKEASAGKVEVLELLYQSSLDVARRHDRERDLLISLPLGGIRRVK
jgi:hypothetical protein